jgi:mono/diheme cytochrome c family protein
MKSKAAVVCGLAIVLLFACKRQSKEIAGVGGQIMASPEYSVTASLSMVSGAANVPEVAPKPSPTPAISPLLLYAKNCMACHLPAGQGIAGAFPPLDGSAYVNKENPELMASIMLYGLIGPIQVRGMQYVGAMVGLGSALTDEELAVIASYVRSSWSNSAAPVSAGVFAQARKRWGMRGPFAIGELGEEN